MREDIIPILQTWNQGTAIVHVTCLLFLSPKSILPHSLISAWLGLCTLHDPAPRTSWFPITFYKQKAANGLAEKIQRKGKSKERENQSELPSWLPVPSASPLEGRGAQPSAFLATATPSIAKPCPQHEEQSTGVTLSPTHTGQPLWRPPFWKPHLLVHPASSGWCFFKLLSLDLHLCSFLFFQLLTHVYSILYTKYLLSEGPSSMSVLMTQLWLRVVQYLLQCHTVSKQHGHDWPQVLHKDWNGQFHLLWGATIITDGQHGCAEPIS